MAIFDGKHLKGLTGNVISRKGKNGKTIVQSVPEYVKQTEGSKQAASVFGNASALSKSWRLELNDVNFDLNDGGMVNRLTTANRAILEHCHNKANKTYSFDDSSFNNIKGFEFNINSLLSNNFWVTPVITHEDTILKVSIPHFDVPEQLKFPLRTNYCEIFITICYVVLEQGLTKQNEVHSFSVTDEQQTVEAQEFNFSAPDGCLCVVAMGLRFARRYNNIQTIYNTKDFSPAAIIGQTLTPGTFIDPPARVENGRFYGKEWSKIDKLNL
ncbi:hypothetical protein ACXZ1K_16670 [Pedobacter sp. PWIIR3]